MWCLNWTNGSRQENVKIQNAVLVSELTNTVIDNEVFDFLKQFGLIVRVIKVATADKEGKAIVEFQYDSTVKELERKYLPYTRTCDENP